MGLRHKLRRMRDSDAYSRSYQMRRLKFRASGALASLLISPRGWCYTVCASCGRALFYTYIGEPCPFCEQVVTSFVEGDLPKPKRTPLRAAPVQSNGGAP